MLRSLDLALLRLMRTAGHSPAMERAVLAYTHAGEHGKLWYGAALAGALLDPPRRSTYLRAAGTVFGAFLANQAIKTLTPRERPRLDGLPPLVETRWGRSYPSAHAATSFAGAGSLSRVLPAPPLYLAATAMALSRVYVGVHHPSDVLAGAALGSAVATLAP